MKFILGKKIGMTTIYTEEEAQNVTLIEVGAKVSLVKEIEKDGYQAVQLEIAKTPRKILRREFRVTENQLKKGDVLNTTLFKVGDLIKVSGISKAKGFQGVVKRYNFAGSPKTHGHKHDLRAPGSIGSAFPEHVIKGRRMAGRMGGVRKTGRNIKVVFIDEKKNILGLKGAVPGIPGNIIEIRKNEK